MNRRKTDNTMDKEQKANNDLQNITHKTKDRATRIPLKPGLWSGVPEGWAVPAPYLKPVVLLMSQSRNFLDIHCICV